MRAVPTKKFVEVMANKLSIIIHLFDLKNVSLLPSLSRDSMFELILFFFSQHVQVRQCFKSFSQQHIVSPSAR